MSKELASHERNAKLGYIICFPQHLSFRFDVETRHVFVGDHSGQVTILKLEQESCSLVTTFKGHTGKASGGDPERCSGGSSSVLSILMVCLSCGTLGWLVSVPGMEGT